MIFSYSEYYNNAFIVPLVFLIVSICFAGGTIIKYNKTVTNTGLEESNNKKSLILTLISCVVAFIIISTQIKTLMYGINLASESVDDAVECVGDVQSIEKVSQSPRYMHNGSVARASIVKVGGKKFYFMSASEIKVGDKISITYLPKSTMVLSYELTDNVSSNDQVVEDDERNDNKGINIYVFLFVMGFLTLVIMQHIGKRYVLQRVTDEREWTKDMIVPYKTFKWKLLSFLPILFFSTLIGITHRSMFVLIGFYGLFFFALLKYRTEKIVYNNRSIAVYNIFGKAIIYTWDNIISVTEKQRSTFLGSTDKKVLNITYRRQSIYKTEVLRNLSFESEDYIGISRFLKYVDDNVNANAD